MYCNARRVIIRKEHALVIVSYTDLDFYLTVFSVDIFVGMVSLGDTSQLSLQSRFI